MSTSSITISKTVFATLLLIIAVLILVIFSSYNKDEYLIPGVPYHGYYNHFHDAPRSIATVSKMVFDYWGDPRYSTRFLMKLFDPNASQLSKDLNTITLLAAFPFAGYEMDVVSVGEQGPIAEVKKYVNKRKKTPLIVLMREDAADPGVSLRTWNLLIGYSDKKETVTLHSYYYGYYYEMPYAEFSRKLTGDLMYAAWPTEDTKNVIGGIDETRGIYSPRHPKRDELGDILVKREEAILISQKPGGVNRAIQQYLDINKIPLYRALHPAFKNLVSQEYVMFHLAQGRYQDAIRLLSQVVIPMNTAQNFTPAYDGLAIDLRDAYPSLKENRFAQPFVLLAHAYMGLQEYQKAINAMQFVFTLQPNYVEEVKPYNRQLWLPPKAPVN